MRGIDCEKFVPICACEGFQEKGIDFCTGYLDGIQCADFDDCFMCHWFGVSGCEYEKKNEVKKKQ